MSYATLMVHLDLVQENDARLRVVGDLAERFTARVIGVAAQAEPVYYADDVDAAGFVAEDLREMEGHLAAIKQRVEQAEERFRTRSEVEQSSSNVGPRSKIPFLISPTSAAPPICW